MVKQKQEFTVAINLNFWLHIFAKDKKQAEYISNTVCKIIQNYIEKKHDNAQGEMLQQIQSKAYLCTRNEAWNALEELEFTQPLPSDSDDSHARYTIALHCSDPSINNS